MQKKLFLTGASGCGKTTLLRRELGVSMAAAGGFVTERIRTPEGGLIGYDLFPSAHAGGVEGFTGARILDYTVRPPVHDNEIFRNEAARLLSEAVYYPYALVDETGGFEIMIPEFFEALTVLLRSDAPCIGVLKGMENAQRLKSRVGLGEKYLLKLQALFDRLRQDPNVRIVDMTGFDDENAIRAVREWAEQYAL